MIYAVEILNFGFVKIGFSDSEMVSKRIAELQTGNPFQIKEVFTIPGTIRQEKSLHAMLNAAFSTTGIKCPPNEWYVGRAPMFKEFLRHLKHGFDFGMSYLGKFEQSMYAGCSENKIARMDQGICHEWGQVRGKESREIPFTQKPDYLTANEKKRLYSKS